MPPMVLEARRAFDAALSSVEFTAQFKAPQEVFSVLLILGGDVVERAIAQLAGHSLTPVAFSFGWVAYSVTALVSAVGANTLMPLPDSPCQVINGKNGYVRDNTSWILGRILRDFGTWMDPKVAEAVESARMQKWEYEKAQAAKKGNSTVPPKPTMAGLCVSIYKASALHEPGHPKQDAIYYSGYAIAVLQLGIAAIPLGLFGDWGIILVTVCGMLIGFATGTLPQWSKEKWACRRNSTKTVVLTRGNGSQHAIVIIGDGKGLDLEDLAGGPGNMHVTTSYSTRVLVAVFCAFWILLLIAAAALQSDAWFLLAIGGVGVLQNIAVAGWSRDPAAAGVPLTFEDVVCSPKVMETLYKVEEKYPNVGRSMLDTFFPGELRDDEQAKWDEYRNKAKALKKKPAAGTEQPLKSSQT